MDRDRTTRLMARRVVIPLVVVVALLGVTTAARAADENYKGWFVALDLATTQPNSLDQVFATTSDHAATPVRTERLTMENDSDLTYAFSVGYGFGRDLGHLKVSYWTFDNEDRQDGSTGAALYPALFGYGYGYGGGLFFSTGAAFQAASKVKAQTYDIDYVRPIRVGERFSVNWLAGLRVAKYEEDRALLADDGVTFDDESKHFESDAKGLRVGVTGVFGFTKHFDLEASMAASFMQADTEGRASQAIGGTLLEIRDASDDSIRGEIRDYDLRAVWRYGHADYYVGYSVSDWDGLVADPLPSSPNFAFSPASQGRDRQSISFNSLHAGVTFRFGNH